MSKLNAVRRSDQLILYQFIYISRITSIGLSGASTLNDIAEVSIAHNKAENISGILCYGNGYFFRIYRRLRAGFNESQKPYLKR